MSLWHTIIVPPHYSWRAASVRCDWSTSSWRQAQGRCVVVNKNRKTRYDWWGNALSVTLTVYPLSYGLCLLRTWKLSLSVRAHSYELCKHCRSYSWGKWRVMHTSCGERRHGIEQAPAMLITFTRIITLSSSNSHSVHDVTPTL